MRLPRQLMKTAVVVLSIVLIGFWMNVWAGEHPSEEHPAEEQTSEEHPAEEVQVTKEELANAIQSYVDEDAKLKGGFFLIFDAEENKTLALKLDKVHKDRLSQISGDVYFACADFQSLDGHMYDLDVFMKGPSLDKLEATEISVHKKDSKARYNWVKEGDFWKRK